MKRLIGVGIVALALVGALAAQSAPPPPAQNAQAVVKVAGKLELINGHIGLKADGVSYYIPRIRQLVGFVKEVQEGAAVKVEGYAWPLPNQSGVSMLALTKLSIGGKDYDFDQAMGRGPFGGGGMRGGMRGGRGQGMMDGGYGERW
jgi:hypothetical protein